MSMSCRVVIVVIAAMYHSVLAINECVNVIYKAGYGNEKGYVGVAQFDLTDDNERYPSSIFIKENVLAIGDWANGRFQFVNLKDNLIQVVPDGQSAIGYTTSSSKILYVTGNGSFLADGGGVYDNLTKTWRRIGQYNVHFAVCTGGKVLFHAKNNFFCVDTNLLNIKVVQESGLKDSISLFYNQVLFLKNQKTFLSFNYILLKKTVNANYHFFDKKSDEKSNVYQFPDSTALKARCQPNCGGELLTYDKYFNSYWTTSGDSLIPGEDNVPVQIFCVFDKFGKRINWFYEPLPPPGWHYGIPLHVNKEGRIFRMLYHETDGIQVVEYLWKNQKK